MAKNTLVSPEKKAPQEETSPHSGRREPGSRAEYAAQYRPDHSV